jgi:hypothetical protein
MFIRRGDATLFMEMGLFTSGLKKSPKRKEERKRSPSSSDRSVSCQGRGAGAAGTGNWLVLRRRVRWVGGRQRLGALRFLPHSLVRWEKPLWHEKTRAIGPAGKMSLP